MHGAAGEGDAHERAVVGEQVRHEREVQRPFSEGIADRHGAERVDVADRGDVLSYGDNPEQLTVVGDRAAPEGGHVVRKHRVVVVERHDVVPTRCGEPLVQRRCAARALDRDDPDQLTQPQRQRRDHVVHHAQVLLIDTVRHHQDLEAAVRLGRQAGEHVLETMDPSALRAGHDAQERRVLPRLRPVGLREREVELLHHPSQRAGREGRRVGHGRPGDVVPHRRLHASCGSCVPIHAHGQGHGGGGRDVDIEASGRRGVDQRCSRGVRGLGEQGVTQHEQMLRTDGTACSGDPGVDSPTVASAHLVPCGRILGSRVARRSVGFVVVLLAVGPPTVSHVTLLLDDLALRVGVLQDVISPPPVVGEGQLDREDARVHDPARDDEHLLDQPCDQVRAGHRGRLRHQHDRVVDQAQHGRSGSERAEVHPRRHGPGAGPHMRDRAATTVSGYRLRPGFGLPGVRRT